MCVNVKIEYGGTSFEMSLEDQKTIVLKDGTDSFENLIDTITRITKAVHIETSNDFSVELLDISKFDNRLGTCMRNLQRKYFGVSEEGGEKFDFFRVSTNPKDKERYQRMLEGYWKALTEDEKRENGGKIFIVNVDSFVKTPEFKALYNSDRVNYYVMLAKGSLSSMGYEADATYQFEKTDQAYRLKRIGA